MSCSCSATEQERSSRSWRGTRPGRGFTPGQSTARSKFGWPQDFSQAEEINRDQIVWLLQGLRAIGFKRGKEVCFY